MTKIAHASSLERCKLQIKKLNKQKTKRKIAVNNNRIEMGEEEYQAMLKERGKRDLKQVVGTAIWDIKHHQFPFSKKTYMLGKMNERIAEIGDEPDGFQKQEIKRIEVAIKWFSE